LIGRKQKINPGFFRRVQQSAVAQLVPPFVLGRGDGMPEAKF
jgi:hypothetical protein